MNSHQKRIVRRILTLDLKIKDGLSKVLNSSQLSVMKQHEKEHRACTGDGPRYTADRNESRSSQRKGTGTNYKLYLSRKRNAEGNKAV